MWKDRTVHIIPIILRVATTNGLQPVVTEQHVHQLLFIARQRYAQVGVDLTWSDPEACDPPAGVNLLDGLTVRTNKNDRWLTTEAKAAIDGISTIGGSTNIHFVYVNQVKIGNSTYPGSSVAKYWYEDASEVAYRDNFFIGVGYPELGTGYAIAHELGHILTNDDHVPYPWRLMHDIIKMTGVTGSRRLGTAEEAAIRGESHVQ